MPCNLLSRQQQHNMGLKLRTAMAHVVSTTTVVAVASIPHYFRCPISLDLMRDPVTLCTGQTYDRHSIEQWLDAGNLSCPVTRHPLSDLSLVPNHTLLRLIQNWCVANMSLGVERIPTPPQPADSQQVSQLTTAFSSCDTGRHERAAALRRLRSLANASDKNKILIAEMGTVPLLISAIFNEVTWSAEDGFTWNEVSEEAIGALVHLRPLQERYICELAQPLRLSFIAHLINEGSMEARIHASSLIESMASVNGESCDHLRSLIGETPGLIEGLVSLLHESHYPTCVKVGVRALFALCLSSSNWAKATRAQTPLELMECLLSLEKRDAERALASIELLCKIAEGREMVAGHAMAVPVMKKMMLKVSDQASECAAGILLAIASHSYRVQEEAVEEAIFTQLLLLLQSQCTCRAKRKARGLLKLLQDNWSQHPCIKVPGITGLAPF